MNNICAIFNNKKGGTAIIMTVLILGAVLVITLLVSDIINNGILMNQTQIHSTQAYFAAEAGAEKVLYDERIRDINLGGPSLCDEKPSPMYVGFNGTNPQNSSINCCNADPSICSNSKQEIPTNTGKTYTLNYDYKESGGNSTTTVISKGSYKDVSRAVELTY